MIKDKEERIEEYLKLWTVNFATYPIQLSKLDELGFFTTPASRSHHGAYAGGLFDHSLAVTKYLVELTEKLGLIWESPRSPYIVGMFHDICKCGLYVSSTSGLPFEAELIIPGHGERSVIMLQRYINLTNEEIACIRWHMGAYEKDPKMWTYYNRAVAKYPNVLFTHTADMYASQVLGV